MTKVDVDEKNTKTHGIHWLCVLGPEEKTQKDTKHMPCASVLLRLKENTKTRITHVCGGPMFWWVSPHVYKKHTKSMLWSFGLKYALSDNFFPDSLQKHCQRHNGPRVGIDSLTWVISPAKYNATCIGSKFGQHVMQLELVHSLATRWCYLH